MEDFPAGHSMDSTWFAVDEAGEVAFFDTGEGGAIPKQGFPVGGEAGVEGGLESWELSFQLLQREAKGDPALAAVLPASAEELGDWLECEQDAEFRLLLSLGVHVYSCGEQDAYPYFRVSLPSQPGRLDQLPEALRERFAGAQLPLRFVSAPQIAPGAYVPVESWSGYWFDTEGAAHLAVGGKPGGLSEAQDFVNREFPNGFAAPAGEYWENIRPLRRDELISLLKQAQECHHHRVAEVKAKKALVVARTRARRGRGLGGLLRRLFGLER